MSRPYRSFLAITYSSEENLIEMLPGVESHLGKYDFFSHFIQLTGSPAGRAGGNLQKIFSMKKLLSWEKLEPFYKKVERIKKQGGPGALLLPGYLSLEQVVTLHEQNSPEKIRVGRNLYARLEFIHDGKKYRKTPWVSPELDSPDSEKFFSDLRRIYQTEA